MIWTLKHCDNHVRNSRCLSRVPPSVAGTFVSGGLDVEIELEFRSVGFCWGRKTWEPGEKSLEQGENQKHTQPTRRRIRESTPVHMGGTGASPFPLRQPCSSDACLGYYMAVRRCGPVMFCLSCNHHWTTLFKVTIATVSLSRVKICFRAKAHMVFHWYFML